MYWRGHAEAALERLVGSGVRSVFCPCPTKRVKAWSPELSFEGEEVSRWFMPMLQDMVGQRPFGDGRMELGLAFDSFGIPREDVKEIFSRARESKLQLITSHHFHGQNL